MKLIKIEIPKSELLSISENERIFFVQLANLLNDLNIFRKLVYFSSKETKNDIIRKAQNSQALALIRIQAGKLGEGWELLQREFFTSKVSIEYEPLLDSKAQEALKKIKDYFGKENLIKLIRNEFAFHYSSGKIKQLINDAPEGEVFEAFLSENHGNCLYFISHVIVNFAILKSIGGNDFWDAMDKLLKEVNEVTLWFFDFLGECIAIILQKYKHLGIVTKEIEIPEPPKMDSVDLPYFVSK